MTCSGNDSDKDLNYLQYIIACSTAIPRAARTLPNRYGWQKQALPRTAYTGFDGTYTIYLYIIKCVETHLVVSRPDFNHICSVKMQ